MLDALSNFPLCTAVTAILISQCLKVPWNFIVNRRWEWRWIFNSGGMPSGHTAAVTSLATSVGLSQGWGSPFFAIATVAGIIVMYDATGVRRHAGMQAQVLNRLVDDFGSLVQDLRHITRRRAALSKIIKLKEILGHQPIEVGAGAICGVAIALIMYWFWFS